MTPMTMMGADPDALDKLAGQFKTAGLELDRLNRSVEIAIRALPWQGQDAIRFERGWRHRHGKAVRQAGTALSDNAAILRRDASEQRKASAAEGGTMGGHSPGRGRQWPAHYSDALSNYFAKELPMYGAKRSSTNV